eukprot:scaffold35831_cov62-Phaeocystis_antarctica.AAC.3
MQLDLSSSKQEVGAELQPRDAHERGEHDLPRRVFGRHEEDREEGQHDEVSGPGEIGHLVKGAQEGDSEEHALHSYGDTPAEREDEADVHVRGLRRDARGPHNAHAVPSSIEAASLKRTVFALTPRANDRSA